MHIVTLVQIGCVRHGEESTNLCDHVLARPKHLASLAKAILCPIYLKTSLKIKTLFIFLKSVQVRRGKFVYSYDQEEYGIPMDAKTAPLHFILEPDGSRDQKKFECINYQFGVVYGMQWIMFHGQTHYVFNPPQRGEFNTKTKDYDSPKSKNIPEDCFCLVIIHPSASMMPRQCDPLRVGSHGVPSLEFQFT